MSEAATPTEDEIIAAQDEIMRSMLCRGQRLPTVEEVRALQERFALTHVPTHLVLSQIAQAGTYYFAHENPQTPNAQAKQLLDVRRKADALLAALGHEWLRVVYEKENKVSHPEPPGLRGMLFQLRDNADKELRELKPFVTKERQRRRTQKGVKSLLVHLADMLRWFHALPTSVYTQDPYSGDYSGGFFDIAQAVCRQCGIHLANQTLGDQIKALHSAGKLAQRE